MNEIVASIEGVHDAVGEIVANMRKTGLPVVLFGAGYCLPMVTDLCKTSNLEILAVADNNESLWGSTVHGIPVMPLADLFQSDKPFQILISTSHYSEIEQQLSLSGYTGVVHHLPMTAYYKNALYTAEYITSRQDDFLRAYHFLADDTSRRVFLAVLKHTISLDQVYYDEVKDIATDGYFGTDLFQNQDNEIIIDAGAYDGDALREFSSVPTRKYKEIYAFEPDKQNFDKLLETAEGMAHIFPVCAGLGAECSVLRFRMTQNVSSKIDPDGGTEIKVETIDHLFQDIPVTFIKMDIEGAEHDALLGER